MRLTSILAAVAVLLALVAGLLTASAHWTADDDGDDGAIAQLDDAYVPVAALAAPTVRASWTIALPRTLARDTGRDVSADVFHPPRS